MFMHLSPKERFGYVAVAAIILVGGASVAMQKLRRPATIELHETTQPVVSFDHGGSTFGGGKSAKSHESSIGQLIVHVVGEVNRPGIITLPAGARVYDAINAAGGFSQLADSEKINLAAKVVDGTQIDVPARSYQGNGSGVAPNPSGPLHSSRTKQPTGIININSADAPQLTTLPGIGPSFAQRIVDYRTAHGAFHSVDDLLGVQGFGKRRLDQIRDWVTAE